MRDVTEWLIAELKRIKGIMPMRRFLIVEDDPTDRELMRITLEKGAIVEIAASADRAIDKFGLDRCGGVCFTRVFLDMSFPVGKQGTDVMEHIRRVIPNTPITVVSGYYTKEMEQELAEMGYDLIDKNCGMEEFKEKLKRYL